MVDKKTKNDTSNDEGVELSRMDRAEETKKHNKELIRRLRIAVAKRRAAVLHRANQ